MAFSSKDKKRLSEKKLDTSFVQNNSFQAETSTAQFNPALVSQSSARLAKNSFMIPIDQLITFQNKGHGDFSPLSDEELRALADSMSDAGPYEPILVRETPEKKFEILSGEQRYRACILKGITSINAIVMRSCSDDEAKNIFLIENLYRRKDRISDKIYGWKEYSELHTGHFKEDFATEKVNESRANVYRYIKCADLIHEYLKSLDSGELSIHAAYQIAFLKEEDQRAIFPFVSKLTISVAKEIRNYAEKKELTPEWIDEFFSEEHGSVPDVVSSAPLQTASEEIITSQRIPISKQKSFYNKSLRTGMRKIRKSLITRIPPRLYENLDDLINEALDILLEQNPEYMFNDSDMEELEKLQESEIELSNIEPVLKITN